MANTILIDYIQ